MNKIFLSYHKDTPIIKTDILTPIHGGKALSNKELGMIGDNTGDNISERNSNWCELTVLYWMWKNVDTDSYGLFHYRRLFDFKATRLPYFTDFSEETIEKFGWDNRTISKMCKKYDIIMPPKWNVHQNLDYNNLLNIYDFYAVDHIKSDMDTALQVLSELFPDYSETAREVMAQKQAYYCNMFIMKKEIFHEYAEWLFSILFEVEKRVTIDNTDHYQKRVFGFLSERLINVFVEHKVKNSNIKLIKVKNIPFGVFDDKFPYGGKIDNEPYWKCADRYVIPPALKVAKPKISVIVPVYNVEKYLAACLNSLVNQTLKDIEIIVVNDGSPDNSQAIIDRYVQIDKRVIGVIKKNGGLSSARNAGLKVATGKYIMFVDSDDYIEPYTMTRVYDRAERDNLEIVMYVTKVVDADTEEEVFDPYYNESHLPDDITNRNFTYRDITPYLFCMQVSAWNKLFRKDLIDRLGAEFPDGLCFEDNPFFFNTMLNAERIGYITEKLYVYRTNRDGSILTDKKTMIYFDFFKIMELSEKVIKESGNWESLKHHLWCYRVDSIYHWYNMMHDSLKPEYFVQMRKVFRSFDMSEYNEEYLSKRSKEIFYTVLAVDVAEVDTNIAVESAVKELNKFSAKDWAIQTLRRIPFLYKLIRKGYGFVRYVYRIFKGILYLPGMRAMMEENERYLQQTRHDLKWVHNYADGLKTELDSTKTELGITKSDLRWVHSYTDGLKAELDSTKIELDATSSDLLLVYEYADELKVGLESTKTELETTRSDLKWVHGYADELKAGLESTKTELDTTRTDLRWVHSYADGLKVELGALLGAARSDIKWIREYFDNKHDKLFSNYETLRGDLRFNQVYLEDVTKSTKSSVEVVKKDLKWLHDYVKEVDSAYESKLVSVGSSLETTRKDLQWLHDYVKEIDSAYESKLVSVGSSLETTRKDLQWLHDYVKEVDSAYESKLVSVGLSLETTRKDLQWLHGHVDYTVENIQAGVNNISRVVPNLQSISDFIVENEFFAQKASTPFDVRLAFYGSIPKNDMYAFHINLSRLIPNLADSEADADAYFIWGIKTWGNSFRVAYYANRSKKPFYIFEDGFLRSICSYTEKDCDVDFKSGISFTVDRKTAYYDAMQQSDLEDMLNNCSLKKQQVKDARRLINKIVKNKLSKYNNQKLTFTLDNNGLPRVLVVDQSYQDASIYRGWADSETFNAMINDAINENPGSEIIVKMHPDNIANGSNNYFNGAVPLNVTILNEYANPITLLEQVDKVYVCTSQLGFEALMCGKGVHVYGMPFYAGWGLTHDKQTCFRRNRKLTLEELFYTAYVEYSYYVNPDTGKKCEIEEAMEYLLKMRAQYFIEKGEY